MDIMMNAGETGQKLMGSLRTLINDAEKVLEGGAQGGEAYAEARDRLRTSLTDAKFALAQVEDILIARAKDVCVMSAEYAKANPLKSVGVVAAAAFMLGMLLGRK